MANDFSPTVSLLRGMQYEAGLGKAGAEGLALRDQLAAKKALASFGSNKFFSGYEGDPRAIRPQALQDLYASDPQMAMQLEDRSARPLAEERAILQAGGIEGAKRSADYKAVANAFPSFFGPSAEGGMNAFAKEGPMAEAPSSPAVGEPQASPAGMPPQPPSNLSSLSGMTKKLKIGPLGPELSAEQLSPFDRANQVEQRTLERQKYGLQSETEHRAAIQEAHTNVGSVDKEIQSVQKAMQDHEMPWNDGLQKIQELKQEKLGLEQTRDALLGGRAPALQSPTAPPVPRPGPRSMSPPSAPNQPMAAVPPPAAPSVPRFTEKEQAAMAVQDRTEKITAANKEITNARLGVEKVLKYLPQMKELHKLVTRENIGHPELEAVPGAQSLLSLNRSNAQVKKLNEAIINMFAEPGQSQMMNTIVERQMQGAVVPGLLTEPQLNKINSSILLSNVEHLRNLPTFLEKWQQQHGGELTGATDAWIDYTDHNPRYGYSKDARGTVTVKENKNVMAPQTWQYLRENKMVRSIGDKTFIKQKDGAWVEK